VKRAVLLVLGFAGLAIPALANNEDIVGWQDAKWGMTPEEVQKVFKYPTRRSDLSKVCGEKCEEGAALELEDYVLDGQHFMVRFWFAKADEHLHIVSMYAKKADHEIDSVTYGKIKQSYQSLYGSPRSVTLKDGYFIVSWVLPATMITLYSNTTSETTIVYQEAKEGENAKGDISRFNSRFVPLFSGSAPRE
jgi:hypothetical protein